MTKKMGARIAAASLMLAAMLVAQSLPSPISNNSSDSWKSASPSGSRKNPKVGISDGRLVGPLSCEKDLLGLYAVTRTITQVNKRKPF